jgi:MtN3 and saliva related transmembrane protein
MFVMLDVGIFLWLVYGIIIGETPVIVANCAGLVLATTLVLLKVRFG